MINEKLTQLINESMINHDFIEDVMIHIEDLGFKIDIFDDINSHRGNKLTLFSNGNITDQYGQMNMYSWIPDYDGSRSDTYITHVISLVKKINPFSDCEIYSKLIKEAETVKRRMYNCDTYYRILSGGNSNQYSNVECDLTIVFLIIDKSKKISKESIDVRKNIQSFIKSWVYRKEEKVKEVVGSRKRIADSQVILWSEQSLLFKLDAQPSDIDIVKNWMEKTLKNRFSVDIEYSELEEMKYSGNGTYGKGTWFVAIITPKL